MSGSSIDDEFAEIDMTDDEFDAVLVAGEFVHLVTPPGIRVDHDTPVRVEGNTFGSS